MRSADIQPKAWSNTFARIAYELASYELTASLHRLSLSGQTFAVGLEIILVHNHRASIHEHSQASEHTLMAIAGHVSQKM